MKNLQYYADIINDELKLKKNEQILVSDILIGNNLVGSLNNSAGTKLSNTIFKSFFQVPNLDNYAHYTNLDSFEKIINSGKIRMYNLNKNFGQEYKDFYKNHNLLGYESNNHNLLGYESKYEELMAELFIFCLTSVEYGQKAEKMWEEFGAHYKGVRLIFEITPKESYDDFRKVFYYHRDNKNQPTATSLKNINERFGDRRLIFAGVSKFGAFYIKHSLSEENEYRFLVKKNTDSYSFKSDIIKDDDLTESNNLNITYIEESFDNHYANFKIVEIHYGLEADKNRIINILQKKGYPTDSTFLKPYQNS